MATPSDKHWAVHLKKAGTSDIQTYFVDAPTKTAAVAQAKTIAPDYTNWVVAGAFHNGPEKVTQNDNSGNNAAEV